MIKKIIALLLLGMTITVMWILFETYTKPKAPTLSVGDQWTYKWVGSGMVPVTEIIDRVEDFEGTQCYVRIRDASGPEFPGAQSIWMTSDWTVLKTWEEDLDKLANLDDLSPGSEVAYFTKYFPGWKLIDFPLVVGKEWGARSHFSVSNVDIEGEIITFELNQNYPNPFNPVTMIRYSIPEESFVKLEIINALGERINLLEDGIRSSGTYESVWNAEAIPSGIYFYRLQAVPISKEAGDPSTGSGQSFVETKKMILLR